jgi:hypothetical protein
MLNPRPARIPDTRESTPGSFCTRQFSTCLEQNVSRELFFSFFFPEQFKFILTFCKVGDSVEACCRECWSPLLQLIVTWVGPSLEEEEV